MPVVMGGAGVGVPVLRGVPSEMQSDQMKVVIIEDGPRRGRPAGRDVAIADSEACRPSIPTGAGSPMVLGIRHGPGMDPRIDRHPGLSGQPLHTHLDDYVERVLAAAAGSLVGGAWVVRPTDRARALAARPELQPPNGSQLCESINRGAQFHSVGWPDTFLEDYRHGLAVFVFGRVERSRPSVMTGSLHRLDHARPPSAITNSDGLRTYATHHPCSRALLPTLRSTPPSRPASTTSSVRPAIPQQPLTGRPRFCSIL